MARYRKQELIQFQKQVVEASKCAAVDVYTLRSRLTKLLNVQVLMFTHPEASCCSFQVCFCGRPHSQKQVVAASKSVVVDVQLFDGCYADGLSPYSGQLCYLLSIERLAKEQDNVPDGSLQRIESLGIGRMQNVDV